MANSEQESCSPTAIIYEQPAKQSQEHARSDISHLTPSTVLKHWLQMDEIIAKVFSKEILKVILFGFKSNTVTFRRNSGIRLYERIVSANSEKGAIVSTDIVGVSQFHKWRIDRIEKLVTKYLKCNRWDVRDVNVFGDKDGISVKWDFKLPEESDDEVNETSQRPAENAL